MVKISKAIVSTIAGLSIATGCLFGAKTSNVEAAVNNDNGVTEEQIDDYINNASLEQKVGQMYVSRTPQGYGQAENDVSKYNLGGLIVYDADMKGETQQEFKDKMARYQESAQTPLLIGVDQEGGLVSRLTHSGLVSQNGDQFAFPRKQYQDAEAKEKGSGMTAVTTYAQQTASLLRSLGINWNYAPDADYSDDSNSFIYQRGFGGVMGPQSYEGEADYIKNVIPAWQHDNLIAATLKHFPGYGDAADTHTGFATRDDSLDFIKTHDMVPFVAGIKAGADSVMVTHVIYSKIDPVYPASLSPIINKLLRDTGFDGVIVTDALEMGAITQFAKEHGNLPVDVLAVEAGNDMIMTTDYATGIPEIVAAVKSGNIKESQINASVRRILNLKNKLGLLSSTTLDPDRHTTPVLDPDQAKRPAGTKQFSLNKVIYNSDNTQATISGQVNDSGAEGSMLMYIIDADTKKEITQCVVGGQGKFSVDIPTTSKVQNIQIIPSDTDYMIERVTVNANIPEQPTQPVQPSQPSTVVTEPIQEKIATVEFVPGYGVNVWYIDNNNKRTFSGIRIKDGARIKTFDTKTVNGTKYYRILAADSDAWMEASYLDGTYAKTHKANAESPISGILTVVYNGKGQVRLTNGEGKYIADSLTTYVPKKANYKIFAKKVINGKTYYRIGTQNQWIPAGYARIII